MSGLGDSLDAVLYRSKGERVASALVATAAMTCVVVAALWWEPGNAVGKWLMLTLVLVAGVAVPLTDVIRPYLLLRPDRLTIRSGGRTRVIQVSKLVEIKNKSGGVFRLAGDVVFPVLVTSTGDVILRRAGYEQQTPREKEVIEFLRKVESVI